MTGSSISMSSGELDDNGAYPPYGASGRGVWGRYRLRMNCRPRDDTTVAAGAPHGDTHPRPLVSVQGLQLPTREPTQTQPGAN
jgi:hypothetical protein